METLEITYCEKALSIKYEVEDQSEIKKITTDYFVYGKNNKRFTFRQQYHIWRLVEGDLNQELENAIIDALIRKYEPQLLCLAYHGDKREIITVSNLNYTGQKYAYSLMCNNSDMGSIYYCENQGWINNLSVKFSAQWFTAADLDILIEMIENKEIAWLKPIKKP